MYPAPFRYHRPASVQEASLMLTELGETAKPIAGGQTLIPILKLRLDEPTDLVDIGQLKDLVYSKKENGWIQFGALSTHGGIAKSDIAAAIPILKDCAGGIADAQVRNRGTIAGSVCAADPNGDWPALLLTLDAEVIITGPQGSRTMAVQDFVQAAYTTALNAGEIVTAIRIKEPSANSGGAYIAYKRAAPALPVCSVGIQLTLAGGDTCQDVRIVMSGAGPKAKRALEAEAELRGKNLSAQLWERVADAAIAVAEPTSDTRGSADYKRNLIRGLLLRSADVAVRRAAAVKIEGSHVYA